jgi:hypothetical protein
VACPTNYSASGQFCILNTKPPTPTPTPPTPIPVPPTPVPNNTNNTGNNNSVVTKSGPIVDQKVIIEGNKIRLSIYFANSDLLDTNVSVDLVDKAGNRISLTPDSSIAKSSNIISLSASLPPGQDLSSYSLIQTTASGPQGNSTLVSAQPSNQLLLTSLTA